MDHHLPAPGAPVRHARRLRAVRGLRDCDDNAASPSPCCLRGFSMAAPDDWELWRRNHRVQEGRPVGLQRRWQQQHRRGGGHRWGWWGFGVSQLLFYSSIIKNNIMDRLWEVLESVRKYFQALYRWTAPIFFNQCKISLSFFDV